MTLDDLRRSAVSRSLFTPVTLRRAIEKLGFVQADPIRAPARAQDLTLRHRVKDYRAGDLERLYSGLPIEEDVLINYGFVTSQVHGLMHPRARPKLTEPPRTRTDKLLAFVRERGEVHPRDVDAHFAHGTVTNYWGGSSNATTQLLEHLHYRGWLRVARRERGTRIYAIRASEGEDLGMSPRQRVDALVDVVVNKYAPLPALSLSYAVRRLRYAVPQWRGHLNGALTRARERLACECVDGIDWYWPPFAEATGGRPVNAEATGGRPVNAEATGGRPVGAEATGGRHADATSVDDTVRLLAPFDPVVWDRRRFELLWNWPYRFEAYTPAAKRKCGYYALPMLWRDRVIGWGNLSVENGTLRSEFGYVESTAQRDRSFARELEAELERFGRFLLPR